ncbi:signal peptidase II [Nanoarchaeota archaeon]
MSKKRVRKSPKYENLLFLIIPLVFILDRVVKIYAKDSCFGVFCFQRALNEGAAFGLLPGKTLLLIVVGVFVLLLILSIYKKSSLEVKIALLLIAAGTLSNMYDRVIYSAVTDVLSVFGSSSFNVADLSNVSGAIILIKSLIKK